MFEGVGLVRNQGPGVGADVVVLHQCGCCEDASRWGGHARSPAVQEDDKSYDQGEVKGEKGLHGSTGLDAGVDAHVAPVEAVSGTEAVEPDADGFSGECGDGG